MPFTQEYTLLHYVGQGAFANIAKARHRQLGYIRAIKVLNTPITDENPDAYRSFLQECALLLKIGNGCHPNIVRVYKPGLINQRAFVEMDYVEGLTLDAYIRQEQKFINIKEVYKFIKEITGALAFCHHDIYHYLMDPDEDKLKRSPQDATQYIIADERKAELVEKYKVIHNDLHANNVMRRSYDGSFVLLDFGLSIQNNHCVKSSSRNDGAVEYMAPEKWDDNGIITTQSDVYGLGILMYEILAGRVPFEYNRGNYTNDLECLRVLSEMHKSTNPPDIATIRGEYYKKKYNEEYKKDFPEWLEEVIRKCLNKKPQDRYHDAKELYDEISEYLKNENDADGESLRNLKKELEKVQNECLVIRNENASLRERNDTLQSSLVKANLRIAELERQKKELEKEILKRDAVIKKLTQQVKNLEDKIKGMAKPWYKRLAVWSCLIIIALSIFTLESNTHSGNRVESVETVDQSSESKVQEVSNAMSALLDNREREIASLKKEVDELNIKLKEASEETNSISDRNELQKQIVSKDKEINWLKEKNKDAQRQIKKYQLILQTPEISDILIRINETSDVN